MNEATRNLIIQWNNRFPLDNWYRKKYNIPFNSTAHRETSQVDIYWEWVEEQEFQKIAEMNLLREVPIVNGQYLKPQKNQEQLMKSEMDLFDSLDIEKIQI